jgi:hypothetical protein
MSADKKPAFLEAKVGEYRPHGQKYVRITAEGCVMDNDMRLLVGAAPIERDVWVRWGDQVKAKTFTRLRVGRKAYLADRVTGTLYNEQTGLSSSHGLRLA